MQIERRPGYEKKYRILIFRVLRESEIRPMFTISRVTLTNGADKTLARARTFSIGSTANVTNRRFCAKNNSGPNESKRFDRIHVNVFVVIVRSH